MGLYTHSTGYDAPAVITEPTASTEELLPIIYCMVDDLYPEVAPDRVRFRNGVDRMKMTDSETITLSVHYAFGHARRQVQRLGAELSPGRSEGLSRPASGPDLPLPISPQTQGLGGHPARDAPPFDEPIAPSGYVAFDRFGSHYDRRVAPLEIGANVDLGR
jgi:hypothetical protein